MMNEILTLTTIIQVVAKYHNYSIWVSVARGVLYSNQPAISARSKIQVS